PMEHDGKFVAETIPAYAAQKNFSAVQAAFPGYSYREPALNPTNLANRAQDWEADIISLFRNEPNRQELVVERDMRFGPTLLKLARPIVVGEQACLSCHSTPAEVSAGSSTKRLARRSSRFPWRYRSSSVMPRI